MIDIRDITYHVGEFNMRLSLNIPDNEYFVLLGMTGCGKTSLIECLCGLRDVRTGSIELAGRDITASPPGSRNIGYVPQDGALFPHLTVRENIVFALSVRKKKKREKNEVAGITAEKMRITHLLDRRISGLSGGERQRVALARALATKPDALFLDEPVSALDMFTRDEVCGELVRIHAEMNIPVIHVCHSFEEAVMVSDRIGVMRSGRIIQTGTADELRRSPSCSYVAKIIRLDNVFRGEGIREEGRSVIMAGDSRIAVECDLPAGTFDFMVRSWKVRIDGKGGIRGRITDIRELGMLVRFTMDAPLAVTVDLSVDQARRRNLKKGDEVSVVIPPDAVYIFGGT